MRISHVFARNILLSTPCGALIFLIVAHFVLGVGGLARVLHSLHMPPDKHNVLSISRAACTMRTLTATYLRSRVEVSCLRLVGVLAVCIAVREVRNSTSKGLV